MAICCFVSPAPCPARRASAPRRHAYAHAQRGRRRAARLVAKNEGGGSAKRMLRHGLRARHNLHTEHGGPLLINQVALHLPTHKADAAQAGRAALHRARRARGGVGRRRGGNAPPQGCESGETSQNPRRRGCRTCCRRARRREGLRPRQRRWRSVLACPLRGLCRLRPCAARRILFPALTAAGGVTRRCGAWPRCARLCSTGSVPARCATPLRRGSLAAAEEGPAPLARSRPPGPMEAVGRNVRGGLYFLRRPWMATPPPLDKIKTSH